MGLTPMPNCAELEDIFATTDILRFELSDVRAAYLDAEDGLFYGLLEFDNARPRQEYAARCWDRRRAAGLPTYDEDKWKLESIKSCLASSRASSRNLRRLCACS